MNKLFRLKSSETFIGVSENRLIFNRVEKPDMPEASGSVENKTSIDRIVSFVKNALVENDKPTIEKLITPPKEEDGINLKMDHSKYDIGFIKPKKIEHWHGGSYAVLKESGGKLLLGEGRNQKIKQNSAEIYKKLKANEIKVKVSRTLMGRGLKPLRNGSPIVFNITAKWNSEKNAYIVTSGPNYEKGSIARNGRIDSPRYAIGEPLRFLNYTNYEISSVETSGTVKTVENEAVIDGKKMPKHKKDSEINKKNKYLKKQKKQDKSVIQKHIEKGNSHEKTNSVEKKERNEIIQKRKEVIDKFMSYKNRLSKKDQSRYPRVIESINKSDNIDYLSLKLSDDKSWFYVNTDRMGYSFRFLKNESDQRGFELGKSTGTVEGYNRMMEKYNDQTLDHILKTRFEEYDKGKVHANIKGVASEAISRSLGAYSEINGLISPHIIATVDNNGLIQKFYINPLSKAKEKILNIDAHFKNLLNKFGSDTEFIKNGIKALRFDKNKKIIAINVEGDAEDNITNNNTLTFELNKIWVKKFNFNLSDKYSVKLSGKEVKKITELNIKGNELNIIKDNPIDFPLSDSANGIMKDSTLFNKLLTESKVKLVRSNDRFDFVNDDGDVYDYQSYRKNLDMEDKRVESKKNTEFNRLNKNENFEKGKRADLGEYFVVKQEEIDMLQEGPIFNKKTISLLRKYSSAITGVGVFKNNKRMGIKTINNNIEWVEWGKDLKEKDILLATKVAGYSSMSDFERNAIYLVDNNQKVGVRIGDKTFGSISIDAIKSSDIININKILAENFVKSKGLKNKVMDVQFKKGELFSITSKIIKTKDGIDNNASKQVVNLIMKRLIESSFKIVSRGKEINFNTIKDQMINQKVKFTRISDTNNFNVSFVQ